VDAVRTGRPLLLSARPVKLGRRVSRMEGTILDAGSGKILAQGEGAYVIPSLHEFREHFGITNVPDEFAAYLRE
jgi:acyl-coenzyme A thioesterase PaaI-like protein